MKAIYSIPLIIMLSGCMDMPLRWQPTEAQKRAADLTVTDLNYLHPRVAEGSKLVIQEATNAARATQTYVGLPKERPTSLAAENAAILDQANADAANQPTLIQGAEAAGKLAFPLIELLLTGGISIGGTLGAKKVVSVFQNAKQTAADAQLKYDDTLTAIKEVVAGIQNLPADVKAQVKAEQAKSQSNGTKELVALAKI